MSAIIVSPLVKEAFKKQVKTQTRENYEIPGLVGPVPMNAFTVLELDCMPPSEVLTAPNVMEAQKFINTAKEFGYEKAKEMLIEKPVEFRHD